MHTARLRKIGPYDVTLGGVSLETSEQLEDLEVALFNCIMPLLLRKEPTEDTRTLSNRITDEIMELLGCGWDE